MFERARGLDSVARAQFLAREVGDEPEVRAEVERLLGLHDAEGPLDDPESALDADFVARAVDEETGGIAVDQIPAAVGPYRPLRLLGRGGMGAVYLAERRESDFVKQVAVKVLRSDRLDDQALRRFLAERRILAGLQHENIASLIDGGTTDEGLPYVVMEHVEGEDLIRHVRRHELGVRACLELFRQVLAAVDYAHQHLIVHRDLKPSNVLVNQAGVPKLLDFGIAKLIVSEGGDSELAPTLTRTGMFVFTPEYASPEQVTGDAITTATDVYSLGLILYELLTGARPQEFGATGPLELERIVCRQVPELPSQRVDKARARELDGDLDNIVLTALRKEPERRYGSVSGLSEDLRRYLEGLPVSARKDTFRYRASKFVRRHRIAVTAGALFLLLLTGSAIGLALQSARLKRQRDIARRESQIAGEVTEFLVGLFELSVPGEVNANRLRAREVLDRGSREIASEVGSAPLVRAALLDAMGRAYLELGLNDEAEPLLEQSLALYADAGLSVEQAEGTRQVARLRFAQGRMQEGVTLARRALDLLEREVSPDPGRLGNAHLLLASVLQESGRTEEALSHATQARASLESTFGASSEPAVSALAAIAGIHFDRGDYSLASEVIELADAANLELYGERHVKRAAMLRGRAVIHEACQEFDQAKACREKALAIDREILGEEHPDVGDDLYALASTAEAMGDFEQAESILRDLLERDRIQLGEHPAVALDLNDLASVLSSTGRFQEALTLFEEAAQLQERVLPPDHPEIATTLSNTGVLFKRWGRRDLARPYFEQALEIRERTLEPDHPALLTSLNLLAVLSFEEGRFEEAEAIYRDVLERRRRVLGDHSQVAGSLLSLGMALERLGRAEEALEAMEQSVELFRRTLPSGHLEIAEATHRLGVMLRQRGRYDEAESYLRDALETRRTVTAANDPRLATTHRELGRCLADMNRHEEALEQLEEALAIFESFFGPNHASVLETRVEIEVLASG